MNKSTFLTTLGILFGIGAIVHLIRILYGWDIQIGSFTFPKWMSLVAVIVGSYFSWTAFKLSKTEDKR